MSQARSPALIYSCAYPDLEPASSDQINTTRSSLSIFMEVIIGSGEPPTVISKILYMKSSLRSEFSNWSM
jgi:hypothetical protein